MTEENSGNDTESGDAVDEQAQGDRKRRPIEWVLSLLSCLVIFAVAGGLLYFIYANEPEATREGATKKTAMLVSVETVSKGDYRPEVVATGTVIPSREIMLSPRVGGEVVAQAQSFIPGGIVAAGETLVKLDPADFEIAVSRLRSALLQERGAVSQAKAAVKQAEASTRRNAAAVRQAKAAIEQAKAAMAIEAGRRVVAKNDFAVLDVEVGDDSKALILREPQKQSAEAELAAAEAQVAAAEAQLAASEASVEAAEADVEAAAADVAAAEASLLQAELDLARTEIKAPFRALVVSRDVNVGSQVNAGGMLGQLVAVDEYWIEATVPLSTLPMLVFADGTGGNDGTVVRIRDRAGWPQGTYREGELLKSVGALDGQTRLARLLVRMGDPLGLAAESTVPTLILESFVEARILAKPLMGVVRINRDYLHQDNKVWVMVDRKLDVRPVTVIFQDATYAYLDAADGDGQGLRDGEQIVVSQLSSVKDGAALRLEGEGAAAE